MYWNHEIKKVELDLSKRFWIFAHADYEACGGMEDIKATFDTLDEAIKVIERYGQMPQFSAPFCIEAGHIYDSLEKEIVMSYMDRPSEGYECQ
jgi:hypothetical protein